MITILDFYADWCQPCKRIAPILEELEKELDFLEVKKIDVETEEDLVKLYNIMSVPTLIFLKDNNYVGRSIGFYPKDKLLTKINEYKNEGNI
jgi:thioredoxin 1